MSVLFSEYEYLQAKTNQLNSVGEANRYGSGPWTTAQTLQAITEDGMTPASHYERYGAYEKDADGRFINPSNNLDAAAYYRNKLLQCQQSGETVNGKTGDAITLDDVVAAFQASGLSPVTHFALYGAAESAASGIIFIYPVSEDQRVPGDPDGDTITVEEGATVYSIEGGNGDNTVTVAGTVEGDIWTFDGDDSIFVSGMVGGLIYAGDGNNVVTITGSVGGDIHAGYGDDILTVGSGATVGGNIYGYDGNDTITVAGTARSINAGDGYNVITLESNATVDYINGGDGSGIITVKSGATVNNALSGGEGNDTITVAGGVYSMRGLSGYGGDDVITVSGGVGVLGGGDGNDTITVTKDGWVDALYGERGDDVITVSCTVHVTASLYGEAGNDTITVTKGATVSGIVGGDGNDAITVESGATVDYLYGGDGNDVITVQNGATVDGIYCDDGNDAITVESGATVDYLYGGDGNDAITVESGATVDYLYGGDGNDVITVGGALRYLSGGAGDDIITLESGATVVNGFIEAGLGADTLSLNGGVNAFRMYEGHSGTFAVPEGGAFDTTHCDVIQGLGSGSHFALSGGWAAGSTVEQKTAFAAVGDNNVLLFRGTYADNAFTASANGSDLLLAYDANAEAGVEAIEAVVLVGCAGMTTTVVDGGSVSFA